MSNSFFKFKQFTVHQDKTAMKVCTDACLFGAWVAKQIEIIDLKNILDIGTGTGLLSLMLAQTSGAIIDAVEINELAAEQAAINFSNCPWKNQLHIHHKSITRFAEERDHLYDLIIANPPFFDNQLKSQNRERNIAMHSELLSLEELSSCIYKLLADSGKAAILLPWNRVEEWKAIAKKTGLFCIKETAVKQTTNHSYFRSMVLMQKNDATASFNYIAIKEGNDYSKDFSQLLAPYYLAL
ncbi:tRNA1(Val) (adenine(37)-N6)-methyltransferase [Sediminibacterium sp.]|uniref:tRNA1(Val) (adenine(37)-N6)-methyltransferase n=1 Tax=Sediminibacterium sp. TaxID=1917865 RepID=UPI003F6FE97E